MQSTHTYLGGAAIDAVVSAVALFIGWELALSPALAVALAAVAAVVLPLRSRRPPSSHHRAAVIVAMGLLPALALAAICALVATQFGLLVRQLLVIPPLAAYALALIAGAVVDRLGWEPLPHPRAWRVAAAAAWILTVALLVTVTRRDASRSPEAGYWESLEPAARADHTAPATNPCSRRRSVQSCSYAIGDRVCLDVPKTFMTWTGIGDLGGFDRSRPSPPVTYVCPAVSLRRGPGSGHATVEVLDDVPIGTRDHDRSRRETGARTIAVVTGIDRAAWPDEGARLGEVPAPWPWKILGCGGVAAAMLLAVAGQVRRRGRDALTTPPSTPYRAATMAAEAPEDVDDADWRYAFLLSLVASTPLLVALWLGATTEGPIFAPGVTLGVALPVSSGAGPARLYIDPPVPGATCEVDGMELGPLPRWGVEVEPGEHKITVRGAELRVVLKPGEVREISSVEPAAPAGEKR